MCVCSKDRSEVETLYWWVSLPPPLYTKPGQRSKSCDPNTNHLNSNNNKNVALTRNHYMHAMHHPLKF